MDRGEEITAREAVERLDQGETVVSANKYSDILYKLDGIRLMWFNSSLTQRT